MTTAQRIKECRQRAGMSQEKVAELMGVSRQAVTKWEAGQSAPSTENLFRLAQLFGTSVDLLLEKPGEPSPAEQMYRLMRAEEEQKAAALQREKRHNLYVACAAAAGYLLIYLLGRLLWCMDSNTTVMGWLFLSRPQGEGSYLYGWLLSRNLFWISAAISILPSLWGKRFFSLNALAGFVLALGLGMLLGPTIYGTGEYGWAYWGGVFLLSLIMGGLGQLLRSRGMVLCSQKTLVWATAYAMALLVMLLLVRSAIPTWQGMPG